MPRRDLDEPLIHVVAGALTAADGRVLIAERPSGKHLAGRWEFPGGKLEFGETRVEALARELKEELGVQIRDPRPLMRVLHRYDFGEVLIDMWVVNHYSGEPQSLDGQRLRWCTLDELDDADLIIADRPLLRALRLPERLTKAASDFYIIGDAVTPGDTRLRGIVCANAEDGVAASGTVDFLVMRSTLGNDELGRLCEALWVPVYAFGLSLREAWASGSTGVAEQNILSPADS